MKYEFKGQAYIKTSRQDKDGCEIVSFQFDVSQAVEVAKMKLLGRDLKDHLPALLEVNVKRVKEKTQTQELQGVTKGRPKQRHNLPRKQA